MIRRNRRPLQIPNHCEDLKSEDRHFLAKTGPAFGGKIMSRGTINEKRGEKKKNSFSSSFSSSTISNFLNSCGDLQWRSRATRSQTIWRSPRSAPSIAAEIGTRSTGALLGFDFHPTKKLGFFFFSLILYIIFCLLLVICL